MGITVVSIFKSIQTLNTLYTANIYVTFSSSYARKSWKCKLANRAENARMEQQLNN